MTTGNIRLGDGSFAMYAPETTKGVFVTPTDPVYLETNTLDATPELVRKGVMANTRSSERLVGRGLTKEGGSWGGPVCPDAGAGLLLPVFGQDTFYQGNDAAAAGGTGAADQLGATGGAGWVYSAAAGTATLTFATTGGSTFYGAAGGYRPFAFVMVGCTSLGAWQAGAYVRQIQALTVATATSHQKVTALTIPGLPSDVDAGGLYVCQLSALRFVTAGGMTLPTFSAETNIGGGFSNQYPGLYMSKYTAKADKDYIQATYDLIGTQPRVERGGSTGGGAVTAFAASTAELLSLLSPFTAANTILSAPQDQTASGTMAQGALLQAESIEFMLDNGIIERPYVRGNASYDAQPGTRKGTFSYKYDLKADADPEYVNYLLSIDYTTTASFMVGSAHRTTTPLVKPYAAYGIGIPSATFDPPKQNKVLGQIVSIDNVVVPVEESSSGTYGEWSGASGSANISLSYSNNLVECWLVSSATTAF